MNLEKYSYEEAQKVFNRNKAGNEGHTQVELASKIRVAPMSSMRNAIKRMVTH